MTMKFKKCSEVKEELVEFAGDTTVHGVRYICTGQHIVKRIIWAITVIGMLTALIAMLINSVLSYYDHDSISSTSLHKASSLTLPAVTICGNTLVHSRSIEKQYPDQKDQIYQYSLPLFEGTLNVSQVPPDFLHFLKSTSQHQYYQNIVQASELFLECLVKSTPVRCAEYVNVLPVEMRMCHTFHSDNFPPKQHQTVNTPSAGPKNGFSILLHTDQYNRQSSLSQGIGFTVLVHDPKEYPVIDERSFVVSAGSEVYMSVVKSELQYLKKPYSEEDCVTDDEMKQRKNLIWPWVKYYSTASCRIKCVSDETFKNCNCSLNEVSGPNACNMYDVVSCVLPNGRETGVDQSFHIDQCSHCLPACTETKYEVKVTQMELANLAAQEYNAQFNLTIDRLGYTKLIVFYDNMRYTRTKQLPAVGLMQLFSNFGGLMGLFLGASLMSVLEWVIFFCCNCCYVMRSQSSEKRKVGQNTLEKH